MCICTMLIGPRWYISIEGRRQANVSSPQLVKVIVLILHVCPFVKEAFLQDRIMHFTYVS